MAMKSVMKTSLEKILFPAPNPPHYTKDSHRDYLFWLPTVQTNGEIMVKIPCMLYSPSHTAQFFVIWCHGNGVDMGTMDMTMKSLSRRLQAHVLIFEYPKYGLLQGIPSSPNKETINQYADCAFIFVRDTLKWPTDRIIIYGHSIGTGPACHLASTQSVGGLILQSPYRSIEGLVREKMPWIAQWINIPCWNNDETIRLITCPILFIHGERDKLIPCHHSQALFDALSDDHKKKLVFLPEDDHNSISDPVILIHVGSFLREYFSTPMESKLDIVLDPNLRIEPKNGTITDEASKTSSSNSSNGYFRSFLNPSMRRIANFYNSMNLTTPQSPDENSSGSFDDVN